jgi:hypothetical protein
MKLAYFDCFSGASGDMILGALIDAGLDFAQLESELAQLGVSGYRLGASKITKQGIAATQFEVTLEDAGHQPHRHLHHIAKIIDDSRLSGTVKTRAKDVFGRLARAEADVHGTTIEKVHFHEVGALDAIVDVVGACIGLEMLGIDAIQASAIPTGSGTVKCDHGVMPVPAPATANLLKGVPLVGTDEMGELTTPTGAAILTTLCSGFGPLPAMTIGAMGYGAGHRDGAHRPNVLRVLIGETDDIGQTDEIAVLEANLDDVSGEIIGHACDLLMLAGALDVFTTPIFMKKGRPATMISVLAEPEKVAALEEVLFRETTTFGIRRTSARRAKLHRTHATVQTRYGEVRVKVGSRAEANPIASPEFEDCRAAAVRHQVPLREVMAEAVRAWHQTAPPPPTEAGPS